MKGAPPLLEIRNLSKSFGGAHALRRVDLEVRRREILGLLGRNGSGKSTLVKILAGVHAPDPGASILFDGAPIALPLAHGAWRSLGLRFVHQNLGLTPTLTVLENLFMNEIARARGAFIDWRALRSRALEQFERFEIQLRPSAGVEGLSPVERAQLAIVRAFATLDEGPAARLIILDEPTPFLPQHDVERLFDLMRRGVQRGASVIFITHDVDEVMAITDRVAVLRDGQLVETVSPDEAGRAAIVEMIVGRSVAEGRIAAHRAENAAGTTIRVRSAKAHRLAATDLELRGGEIVGLTGLIGSGYDLLPQLMFGAVSATGGDISFSGAAPRALEDMTPSAAIALGMAFAPADRIGAGCIDSLSIADNLFIPHLAAFASRFRLDRGRMARAAKKTCIKFEIRPPEPSAAISTLSGGNAQKVLMARCLRPETRLLLLIEPTQGVDVGTRRQIMQAVREAADQGACVVWATSDADQLADLCDRVAIFAQERLRSWIAPPYLTKNAIVAACYAGIEETAPDLDRTHA